MSAMQKNALVTLEGGKSYTTDKLSAKLYHGLLPKRQNTPRMVAHPSFPGEAAAGPRGHLRGSS